MARRRSDLERIPPSKEVNKRILILCGGRVTEPGYLTSLSKSVRNRLIDVDVVPSDNAPRTLVQDAVARKKEADELGKIDPNDLYDEIWCCFDIDDHSHIRDAKQQAEAHDIRLAISNPCFELWLVLHFADHTAYITTRAVQSLCRKHIPGYTKRVPFEKINAGYLAAVKRAAKLDKTHDRDRRAGENPSTGVYLLTERIIELSKNE